jgi:hypothetical protein
LKPTLLSTSEELAFGPAGSFLRAAGEKRRHSRDRSGLTWVGIHFV